MHTERFKAVLISMIVAATTSIAVVVALFGYMERNPNEGALSPGGAEHPVVQRDNASLVSSEQSVIDVVKQSDPAVVAITVSKNVPVYERYLERAPSPFGGFFGGDAYVDVPRLRQNGTELQEVGGGSGFLVSSDGYIVTNRHVVDDTDAAYTVFLNDGNKYDAEVIARDPVLDLAVIKIDGTNFDHLSFGDSDQLEVGQTVISIGNALAEFRNTVSVGVVSGLARSITASDRYHRTAETLDELIQTDAAINEGNSGGPLLDLTGNVIGVNVAVARGAENIGFALTANSVKHIVSSVQETGKIVRPYLGVRYIPVTKDLAQQNSMTIEHGALVQRGPNPGDLAVIPGSPADRAGIVENDIILEVDGTKVAEGHDLASLIRGKQVGDTLSLTVWGKGEERTVPVILQEMPN